MKCEKCGHDNNKPNAKFCSRCGQPLIQSQPDNSSKIIVAVLVVVIVALIVTIGYFALFNNHGASTLTAPTTAQSDNSSSNVQSDSSSQQSSQSDSSKEWELIGTYSGSGSGSQSVSVPSGQIMIKLSAYPIKNYATNHLYVTGSNGESAGVDWGSTSAVETRSNSLSYTSSSTQTFTIDYYETVSWQVEIYRYQ